MQALRGMVILTLLASATGFAHATDPKQSAEDPYLLQFVHDVAKTAGLQPLRTAILPTGASEIRIWTGFGVASPEHLVVLRQQPGGDRTGSALSYQAVPKAGEDTTYHRRWLMTCASSSEQEGIAICEPRSVREIDWTAIGEAMEQLGIRSLPDESRLPKRDDRIKDGTSILIEIKEADTYRAYHYSNPGLRSDPHARAAAEIMQVAHQVFEER